MIKVKVYWKSLLKEPTVNSRLTAIQIISQKKAFYSQRIPESNYVRKETADIDILRNGDRKTMQYIRIMSRPSSRKKKWNQLSQF